MPLAALDVTTLWSTEGFPPRWLCGQWTAWHGWTHIVADFLIWAAYFTIPFLLLKFVSKRRYTPFQHLFILFALFVFFCGLTHLIDALIFWLPLYRMNAMVKAITAIISWITITAVAQALPQATQLKSTAEMEKQIEERTRTLLESEARSRQMARFTRLSNRIAEYGYETNDFLDTLSFALKELRTMLGWEVGHIYLYDPNKRSFYSSKIWACNAPQLYSELIRLTELTKIPKGQGLVGLTADISKIRWIGKIAYDTPFVMGKRLLAGGITSFLGIPIVVNGQTIAVMEYLNPQVKVKDEDIIEHLRLIEITLSRFKERLDINQQRNSYITTLTHDMKTPLRSEVYICQKLLDGDYGELPQTPKGFIRDIRQSATYMLNMIENVLTNFKLGFQSIQLNCGEVNLNQLVENICNHDVVGLAEERGHTLTMQPDSNLPVVWMDEQAMRRVIYNLLQNAIDYTPVGGTIEVTLGHTETDATITVQDSGPGIAADQRHLLFTAPHTHIHPGQQPRYRGTGLGLFVCHQLVHAHGGKISYIAPDTPNEHCPNPVLQGACFRIYLPLTPSQTAALVDSKADFA